MFLPLAFFLALGVSAPVSDQPTKALVKLGLQLASQTHCRSIEEPAIAWIDLKLVVIVLNTSESPVIVRRDALEVLGFVISQPGQRPLEMPVGHRTVFADVDRTKGAPVPSEGGFVVVPPGARHETTAATGIPLDLIDLGAVVSGEASLVFELASWNETDELTHAVQERWRRFGVLWTNGVAAAPLALELVKRPTVPCRP